MLEIKQIIITRNTVAGRKAVEVGDVLTVGEDITGSEALYLTQINKAVSDIEAEKDADARARAKRAMTEAADAETDPGNEENNAGDPGADKQPEIDPSKMTGPDPENREEDQEEKTAKRGGKKKGRR